MHNFSIVRQSVRMALTNIRHNKLRSFLTMLGIMIGVAAVIGLVTIVQSATTSIMDQFSGLGAGTLTITANGTSLKVGLSDRDLENLSKIDGVDAVCPSNSITTYAVANAEIYKHVNLGGEDFSYFQRNKNQIQQGRTFLENETDGYTDVCLVDKTFATKVLSGQNPIGATVTVNGYQFQVIGLYSDSDSLTGQMTDTSSSNGWVMIPYKNFQRMTGNYNTTYLTVYLKEDADQNMAEHEIRALLNNAFNDADNSFSIINLSSLLDTMNSIKGMLSTMLGGIAAISLVVGGIGIMNMMLVSVSERTKEIGLRKALGAEPVRIQMQFLIESITLSLIGGAIGIVLGLVIAAIGAAALNTTFHISTGAILLGAGFSAGVGILFGWMPARRASELNPIDALRAE
ncbi:MAG: ABC transporter permease [Firmicutes bacterium]|nr:ABC transporter permease [Bacillota bacterium]